MNLLFTGRGRSGSWIVRGEQLGQACGAALQPRATAKQCAAADRIVVVKRVPEDLAASLRDRWWAWDIVDAYPQPVCTGWTREESIAWVRGQLKRLNPSAVIWPNRKMREDCDDGRPGLVLPHHYRPGIAPNPIRETVKVVGYEGAAAYLGNWRPILEEECRRRGWTFRVNPERLADLDIVVALRSPEFSGYAQRHWKSNIKLSNAHGSGTPFVGQQENGYLETATGAEYWAENKTELVASFDWLDSQGNREQISDRFRQAAYPLEQAASDLRQFLEGQ